MADHGGCGINSRSVALRNVAGRSIDPVSASAMAVHPHRERRKPDVFEREAITLVCFFASGKQNSFVMRLTDAVWRPSALAIAEAVDF